MPSAAGGAPDVHEQALLLEGHGHALGREALGQDCHLRPVRGLEELVPVLWGGRLSSSSSSSSRAIGCPTRSLCSLTGAATGCCCQRCRAGGGARRQVRGGPVLSDCSMCQLWTAVEICAGA